MTPQQLNLAIAKDQGWKFIPSHDSPFTGNALPECWESPDGHTTVWTDEPVDYCSSLDAIQKAALARFTDRTEVIYFEHFLMLISNRNSNRASCIWQLTALDWAEAYARASGIWEGES